MPFPSFTQLKAYFRRRTLKGSSARRKSSTFGNATHASDAAGALAHDKVIQQIVIDAMGLGHCRDSSHIATPNIQSDTPTATPQPPTTFVEHFQSDIQSRTATLEYFVRKSHFRHGIKCHGHNYRFSRVLGRGSHGVVRLAYDGSKDRPVAIKIVDRTRLLIDGVPVAKGEKEDGYISDICRERDALRLAGATGSPFLPTLLSFFQDLQYFYLVMPRYYISLSHRLEELTDSNQVMNMTELRHHAAEIVLAVEALHHYGCFHCDIKPENLMFTEQGHLVLVDFSLSEIGSGVLEAGGRGTPGYIPPEALDGRSYYSGHAANIYAMGVVFLQMYLCPRRNYDIFNDKGDITMSVWATWHRNEEVAEGLIQELMEKNPDVRLPMRIIKAHPFFYPGLDWHKVQMMEYESPYVPTRTLSGMHHTRNLQSTTRRHSQINEIMSIEPLQKNGSERVDAGRKGDAGRELEPAKPSTSDLKAHQHRVDTDSPEIRKTMPE
ncbi:kinase-like domain-containing protein [Desarmillaria tabescens]|uniref:non-specific serine/threonine protein kinase n=1 Tax=Armillaria tabescens TaxID=1929756 RepID=A0AA39N2S1_ARMTA|nr:kinase-like domain-containing protein [Desarmillaria tabescens]KAK0455254.1 kinase-like domain-containing protein [Desarmillaria tabescens]